MLFTILLAPLYWFHFVEPWQISLAKKILFVLVFLPALVAFKRLLIRSRKRSLVLCLITVAGAVAVSGLANNFFYFELAAISGFILLSYSSGVIFTMIVGPRVSSQVLSLAGIAFAAISFLVILAGISPLWNVPNPLYGQSGEYDTTPYLSSSAFGLARTTWAASAVVFLGLCFRWEGRQLVLPRVVSALSILISLVVMSTKSGTLLGLLIIAYWIYLYRSRSSAWVLAVGIPLLVAVYVIVSEYSSDFRLDSLLSGDLSTITTGRTLLFGRGLAELANNPWLGIGEPYYTSLGYESVEIHNVPINYAIRYGLPLVGVFCAFLAALVWGVVKRREAFRLPDKMALAGVLAALSTLLWEPQTVISYSHAAFPVWFVLGCLSASVRVVSAVRYK